MSAPTPPHRKNSRPIVITIDALQQIAEASADLCPACRELRAALATRKDPRREPEPEPVKLEHDHVSGCQGASAWEALAKLAQSAT